MIFSHDRRSPLHSYQDIRQLDYVSRGYENSTVINFVHIFPMTHRGKLFVRAFWCSITIWPALKPDIVLS